MSDTTKTPQPTPKPTHMLGKKLCAYRGNGRHYFVPETSTQIFCCRRCAKRDEYDGVDS
jgi:hypothetical protein